MNTGRIIFWLILATLFNACQGEGPEQNPQTGVTTQLPEIQQLTTAIQESPQEPDLYYQRAALYYQNEGYDEALNDLGRALAMDSTNIDYLHLQADVYLDYFRSRDALATMKKVVRYHPEHIPSLLKLSEFQLILRQNEPSMRTIDRILQLDPQNAEAYFMFGMNFKEMGDTVRAINSFQKAVDNDPDIVDAWINLGQLYAGLGDPIAERYFDNGIRVAPDRPEPYHAKAYYLQAMDNLEGAIRVFREINRIDPQYEDAYFNIGLLYLDMDSVPKAYKAFDNAIEVSPLFIRAYYFRGVAAELMGDISQARRDYEQALTFAPDYEDAQRALEQLPASTVQ